MRQAGFVAEIGRVSYEFQAGGDQMIRIYSHR
jgi:hypothetical protein